MNEILARIPKGILFIMICVSLLANAFNFAYSQAINKTTHDDVVKVCKTYAPTTHAVNSVHTLFHDLIQNSLNSAIKRIGTSKELPSDKANVIKFQKYINKFIIVKDVDCNAVVSK